MSAAKTFISKTSIAKPSISKTLGALLLAATLFAGLALAWWGWQNLDPSLLLLGSRLC